MYIGWLIANVASAIDITPINKMNIDVNFENLVILENNPVIPKIIMINPTR